jgi:hypothetical protein
VRARAQHGPHCAAGPRPAAATASLSSPPCGVPAEPSSPLPSGTPSP